MFWLILAMLLGVSLLLGSPLEGRLGRSNVVSALIAALAIGVTGLSVLELLGGSSERAGSYGLVHETVGGIASFLCGWSLTAGAALLAASLIQAAANTIAVGVGVPLWSLPIAFGLLFLLLISLILPFDRSRRLRNGFVVVSAVALAVLLLVAAAQLGWTWPATARSPDAGDLWREAARLSVLYFGFEVVLAARRQLRRDAPTMGRAIGASIGLGVVVFGLPLLLTAGVAAGQGETPIWQVLTDAGVVANPLAALAVSLTLLVSAHALLTTTARGFYDMSRAGALPAVLRRLWRPFIVPPLVHLASGVATGALLLLAGRLALLDLAAVFVLVVALLVNVAAIVSRRVEPDRRRLLLLPFFPLVPALAITAVASLLLNLPGRTQLAALGWLGIGVMIYVVYARRMQVAAQEGVTLFGPDQRIEKAEGSYRILVPLAPDERKDFLLNMAVGLAKQLEGDVLPLQVIPVPDPLAMEEGRRKARERNKMFRWSTRLASEAGVPVFPITRLARTVQEGIVDTAIEESCDLLLMPWSMAGETDTGQMGGVLDPVISQSPCDTAVLAYHPDAPVNGDADPEGDFPSTPEIRSILVPTAGGPHAPLAVGLALVLARQYQAKVTAVYVAAKGSSQAEIEAGEARIQATIEAMREKAALALHREEGDEQLGTASVESKIILSDDVVEGIGEASKEFDLAIIGASEESMIDQELFGNLPRRIAGACQPPVIMVRRYRGLPRFWLRRIWDSISTAFPTLDAEQQIDLYKRVRRGARPDVDFFVMMGLSATIGALGLLLNSGAVIIGAMLVAPLFTPILAFSLAIATGNTSLLRLAFESTLKGVFLSIGLALLIGALAPLPPELSSLPEIASRIQPNLLDLAVALAAGAAGAYAIARQDVA
ncbi:MAG: universal stress protein, partial [Anaerolineales bacterium]